MQNTQTHWQVVRIVLCVLIGFGLGSACTLAYDLDEPQLAVQSETEDMPDMFDVSDIKMDMVTETDSDQIIDISDIIDTEDTTDILEIDTDICANVQCNDDNICCDIAGIANCINIINDANNCGGCGINCNDAQTCATDICIDIPDTYISITAGNYIMGSPGLECPGASCTDPRCDLPEGCPGPELGRKTNGSEDQHLEVIPNDLWVKLWPVTQDEWFAVMGTTPWLFSNCVDDCPAEQITLETARDYCNALSVQDGFTPCYDEITDELVPGCNGYRLPTRKEHEYFTRAGSYTAHHNGELQAAGTITPLDTDINIIAWYGGNAVIDPADFTGTAELCTGDLAAAHGASSECGPHRVAQKQPNAWGIYDSPGLVTEWLEPEGDTCMIAGCSWSSNPENCRAASVHQQPCSVFQTYPPGQGLRPVRTK